MTPKLIVALDFDNQTQALTLVDKLDPSCCALKVGSELFTLLGLSFVKTLIKKHYKVFLDLKFHDIPNTVSRTCKICAELGIWMLTVHALGGYKMMNAATKALEGYQTNKPLVVAVTILTSFEQQDLKYLGMMAPMDQQVQTLALLARDAGVDGVVSSAFEVSMIKQTIGAKFITVTPGIRLNTHSSQDQVRIMTPKKAIQAGSDFLVVGRPITEAPHPEQVVDQIIKDIHIAEHIKKNE